MRVCDGVEESISCRVGVVVPSIESSWDLSVLCVCECVFWACTYRTQAHDIIHDKGTVLRRKLVEVIFFCVL